MRQVAISLMLATLLFPAVTLAGKVRVEVLQNQLAHPWALAFLPDDQGILITLRSGELKRWRQGEGLSAAITGVPRAESLSISGLISI